MRDAEMRDAAGPEPDLLGIDLPRLSDLPDGLTDVRGREGETGKTPVDIVDSQPDTGDVGGSPPDLVHDKSDSTDSVSDSAPDGQVDGLPEDAGPGCGDGLCQNDETCWTCLADCPCPDGLECRDSECVEIEPLLFDSIYPQMSPLKGMLPVKIVGKNFTPETEVFIDDWPLQEVTHESSTVIYGKSPPAEWDYNYYLPVEVVKPGSTDKKTYAFGYGDRYLFSLPAPAVTSIATVAASPKSSGAFHVATTSGSVFSTSDGGQAWKVNADLPVPYLQARTWDLALGPNTGAKLAMTGQQTVWLTVFPFDWKVVLEQGTNGASNGHRIVILADASAFLATAEAVWFSGDLESWSTVSDTLPKDHNIALALSPSDEDVLYVLQNSALSRSADGGESWEKKWEAFDLPCEDLVILPLVPERLLLCHAGLGIYKSDDEGATFQQVHEAGCRRLAPAPGNPDIVYARGDKAGSVLKSTDGGLTFAEVAGPCGSDICTLQGGPAVDCKKDERVVVGLSLEHGSGGGVRISQDGGQSWAKMTQGLAAPPINHAVMTGSRVMIALGRYLPNGEKMAELLRTEPYEDQFELYSPSENFSTRNASVSVDPFDSSKILVGVDNLGVAASENDGESFSCSWPLYEQPVSPQVAHSGSVPGQARAVAGLYGEVNSQCVYGWSGGPLWKLLSCPYEAPDMFLGTTRLLTPYKDALYFVRATGLLQAELLRSWDGGLTFTDVAPVAAISVSSVAHSPNSGRLLAGHLLESTVYLSTDHGASWSETGWPSGYNAISILEDPLDTSYVYAAAQSPATYPGFAILVSEDDGQNWSVHEAATSFLGLHLRKPAEARVHLTADPEVEGLVYACAMYHGVFAVELR